MGEYHPHFDTTPDYLNIAASARGVRGSSAACVTCLGLVKAPGICAPKHFDIV